MPKCLRERLHYLTCHDAYLLLRHSLAIPKLLYLLRTSPCFLSSSLKIYDDELRATVCSSFDIQLAESDPSWTQSTLPVRRGGLGIRSAVQLAPSAFLASAAASSGLAHLILPANLPANMQPPQLSYVDEALAAWSQGCQEQPLTDAAAHHQKTWDTIRASSIADALFTDSSNPMHRARFLAASCKESGAWLNALPVTSLGLRMDNATMRISMGLRLGLPLCQSHTCQHCGAEVSQFATHGLSCRKSAGRHHRQHMFHHVWSLQVCIVQMGSDLMVFQLSLGSVGNFWCEMRRVRILLHLLTPQLLHTKLEQLLNRQKIGRCRSINTLTHATFSLQWQ